MNEWITSLKSERFLFSFFLFFFLKLLLRASSIIVRCCFSSRLCILSALGDHKRRMWRKWKLDIYFFFFLHISFTRDKYPNSRGAHIRYHMHCTVWVRSVHTDGGIALWPDCSVPVGKISSSQWLVLACVRLYYCHKMYANRFGVADNVFVHSSSKNIHTPVHSSGHTHTRHCIAVLNRIAKKKQFLIGFS